MNTLAPMKKLSCGGGGGGVCMVGLINPPGKKIPTDILTTQIWELTYC